VSIRAYVPLTSSSLASLVADGRLAGPVKAHAVTPALRAELPGADEEELEYAATYAAADESWDLRGESDSPRRFVAAVDVPAVTPLPDDITTVEVPEGITMTHIAALHCDTSDVTFEQLEGELAWFATQEIADLVQSG